MTDSWTLIEYWGKSSPSDDDAVLVGSTTERQVSGAILTKVQAVRERVINMWIFLAAVFGGFMAKCVRKYAVLKLDAIDFYLAAKQAVAAFSLKLALASMRSCCRAKFCGCKTGCQALPAAVCALCRALPARAVAARDAAKAAVNSAAETTVATARQTTAASVKQAVVAHRRPLLISLLATLVAVCAVAAAPKALEAACSVEVVRSSVSLCAGEKKPVLNNRFKLDPELLEKLRSFHVKPLTKESSPYYKFRNAKRPSGFASSVQEILRKASLSRSAPSFNSTAAAGRRMPKWNAKKFAKYQQKKLPSWKTFQPLATRNLQAAKLAKWHLDLAQAANITASVPQLELRAKALKNWGKVRRSINAAKKQPAGVANLSRFAQMPTRNLREALNAKMSLGAGSKKAAFGAIRHVKRVQKGSNADKFKPMPTRNLREAQEFARKFVVPESVRLHKEKLATASMPGVPRKAFPSRQARTFAAGGAAPQPMFPQFASRSMRNLNAGSAFADAKRKAVMQDILRQGHKKNTKVAAARPAAPAFPTRNLRKAEELAKLYGIKSGAPTPARDFDFSALLKDRKTGNLASRTVENFATRNLRDAQMHARMMGVRAVGSVVTPRMVRNGESKQPRFLNPAYSVFDEIKRNAVKGSKAAQHKLAFKGFKHIPVKAFPVRKFGANPHNKLNFDSFYPLRRKAVSDAAGNVKKAFAPMGGKGLNAGNATAAVKSWKAKMEDLLKPLDLNIFVWPRARNLIRAKYFAKNFDRLKAKFPAAHRAYMFGESTAAAAAAPKNAQQEQKSNTIGAAFKPIPTRNLGQARAYAEKFGRKAAAAKPANKGYAAFRKQAVEKLERFEQAQKRVNAKIQALIEKAKKEQKKGATAAAANGSMMPTRNLGKAREFARRFGRVAGAEGAAAPQVPAAMQMPTRNLGKAREMARQAGVKPVKKEHSKKQAVEKLSWEKYYAKYYKAWKSSNMLVSEWARKAAAAKPSNRTVDTTIDTFKFASKGKTAAAAATSSLHFPTFQTRVGDLYNMRKGTSTVQMPKGFGNWTHHHQHGRNATKNTEELLKRVIEQDRKMWAKYSSMKNLKKAQTGAKASENKPRPFAWKYNSDAMRASLKRVAAEYKKDKVAKTGPGSVGSKFFAKYFDNANAGKQEL